MNENHSLFDQLKFLEEKLLLPEVRNSDAELDELITADFTEFGSSGKIYDKQMVIVALKNADEVKFLLKDFYVKQISSEVALVTYIAVIKNASGINTDSLRSSLWRLTNGKWQIIFHQGTAITVGNK